MTHISPDDPRLKVSINDLCAVFARLRDHQRQLHEVLEVKEQGLIEVRLDDVEVVRIREEELLRNIIEDEKERLLITEEIGDLIDHENPGQLKVSEILPLLNEDQAVRLSDERSTLRHIAQKLSKQNQRNRALIEHSLDHIQLFISRLAAEREFGQGYDDRGNAADSPGSFLMDRRG